ncbi:MAG: M12 family metallo-peptidase [Pseudomonadales bacterium]
MSENELVAAQALLLELNIEGVVHVARLHASDLLTRRLRAQRSSRQQITDAVGSIQLYRGEIAGFPGSTLRMAESNGHWRGLALFQGKTYRLNADESALREIPLRALREDDLRGRSCGLQDRGEQVVTLAPTATAAAPSSETAWLDATAPGSFSSASTSAAYCSNPIDGVCLLPEIEFAYDISYQNLPGGGLSAMQRALSEINELEMFFERAFNFRFTRVSITMLNAAQDALVGDSDNANTLLDRLRVLRGSGQLDFLQNPRSIFHFVTGRDFPATPAQGNIVGLAYLSQVCAGSGLNTGLTDAGDTPVVSLVMAHEIGHNLGAMHDDPADNGCAANQFVMSGSIGSASASISDFSSCSVAEINAEVEASLSTSCFDFPVDVSIVEAAGNPDEPPAETPFGTVVEVIRDDGYLPVDALRIEAIVDTPANGYFTAASVAGGSCSVFADTVSCLVSNPAASIDLTLTSYVEAGAEEFTLSVLAQSETVGTADLIESNNVLSVSYDSFGPPLPTSPAVEPPANNVAASAGGGGGGTSGVDALLLLFCAALKILRVAK